MKNSTTIDSNQLAEDLSTSIHYGNDHNATFSIPGIVKSAQEQLVDDLAQEQVYKETRDRMFEQSAQQVKDDDNWVSNFLNDVWQGVTDFATWKRTRQIANTISDHGEDMYTRWWDNYYKGESDRAFGDWSNNHLLQLQIEDAINYIRYIQSSHKDVLQVDEQTLAKWENSFDEVANKIGLENIDREYADQIKREQQFNKSRFSIEPKTSTDLKFLFRQKPELLDQYATNIEQRAIELSVEMDELIEQGYELQETRKEWLANRKPYSEEFLAAEAKPFFQDFESTLIKIPGLMGSSSTGLDWQALNYVTGAVNGALVSTGAAATPIGAAALVGSVGLSLYSQIKSREAETNVELWNAYKDRVFSNLTPEAREQVLRQAKEQADEDVFEEELITGILTGRYQVNNGDYARKSLDALSDLSYLYNDNMALATSDVLQTSLTIVPFAGAAAKWVKSGIKGTKLMRGASNMLNKAVTFGVAKDLKNLAKLQLRHKYAIGIGGVVGSSYLELAEEGKQWFSADRYKRGDYNYDPGFIPSMLNLMKDGIRVPISFFDRELMSNADYVEGLKGGALLGGGMGAVLSGTTGMVDAYQTNKSSKELVQIMGHDYFADREDIRTGVQFAEAARKGRTNRLNEAFDFIKKYNLSELDSELMQAQQDKANRIISAYQNKNVRNAAKSLGIIKSNTGDKDATTLDNIPGTQFDVYLALRDFYNRQFENAKQVKDRYANVGIPGIKVNTDGTISAGDKVFATNTVQLVAASQLADQSLLDIDAAAQQSAIDAIKSEIKFVDDLATDLRQSGVKLPNSITESLSNVVRRQLSAIQARGIGVTPEGLKDTEEFKQAVEDYKRKLYADAAFDYYLHKASAYEGVRDIADNEVELLQKVYDAQGTPKTPAEIRKQHEKNNDKIRKEVVNDIARYFGSIEDDVNLQQNIDELNEQSAKESAEEPIVVTNNDVDPETQEPAVIIPENAEESTEIEEFGDEESIESTETLEPPIEEQTQVETQPEEIISEDSTEYEQEIPVDDELDTSETIYSPEAITKSQPGISKEEVESKQVHEEEQLVEEITIPELHRESYHMDGFIGKYEENKPYIENSAKKDFLSASDLYFTLEGDDVYLIVDYKGTQIKVKFTEGYFSKTGINETEVNKEIISKVKALLRSVSGTEKRVIPLGVHRSTPDIKFGRNAEGLPEYKALSLQVLGVSNIFDIDLSTVPVAISHSNGLYLNKMPYNSRVIAPGTAVLLLKPKFTENAENTPVQIFLHHTMFSERPEMATTIVDALLNINASNFKNLPISSQQLIMFFLNFGETTKIDERTIQINPNLKKKEIYFDKDGKLIVAGTPFILDEARNNSTIRQQLIEKIQANLNFKIDETYLNVRFNGLPTTHPLRAIYDYFRLGNTNAISIGGVTFTKEHFGFGENKKAVTLLGWLIDQQILTSDFVGFSNAKISIKDAAIVEPIDDVSNIQPTPTNPKSEETINDEKELVSEPEFDAMSELFGEGYSDLVGPNKIIPMDANIVNQVGSKEAIEVRWVEDVLGLSEEQLKILPDFLEDLGNNLVSVGRATEDGIILSQGAPVGTTYHEAFHRVSNLFLKGWQRKLIYDRARKRYKMPNLTDVQIDELLADDYANFMVNEGIKLDYQVKGMFKKINLFRHIASKTNSRTFAAFIYYVGVGKFKKAKPSARNKARFKDLAASGAFRKTIKGRAFKHISSNSQISNILDGLQFALLRDVVSLGDVSTIDLNEFGSKIQKLAEKDTKQKYPALQDIAEHWDFFKKELVNKLSKFDTDKQLARQINEDIENTDGDSTGKDIAQYDKNSYESSHYQSAPKEVKFFFSRLAMTGFDVDGNEKVVIDPSTGFPRIINSALAWNTVLNDLHNCDSVQSLLDAVNKLAQQDLFYKTVARHLNKYVAMSKSSNKDEALVADTMLTKLLTTIHSHKHTFLTGKINNRTDDKYEVQIIDNGVDIMSVKYPKVWSASLVSSEADSIFQATESGIKVTNNGLNTIRRCRKAYNNLTNALNKNGIITVGDKAYDLHRPENLEKAKNQIVAILNSLGIAVDKGTIEEAMRNPAYGDQLATPYDRFKAFVLSNANFGGISSILNLYGNDTNPVANILVDLQGNVTSVSVPQQRDANKEYQPRQLYENQGFVKFLSSQFVKHAQSTRELRSIGAQGNLYYPISQNNYASDHVNELNQRGQVVDNLRKVHWSSSSLILDQLNNPNTKLTLETLIAFRTSDSRDQGRDYFDITDREDYITKMALTATDRIVFPTVADKKTYHTITGIRLFHDNLSFSATKQTDGKFRLDALFSDAVTSQFIAYAMSELAAIEQCIEQVNGGLDKSQFIKNYHTNNFYKTKEVDPNTGEIKEVRHTVSPNGTRFRFLTGVYVYEDVRNANGSITTKEKFVSFNNPKETAEKNLEIANKYFFGDHVSDAERRFMISKLLQKQVEKEIKYLAKIGVIDQNSAGQIKTSKNNLLDQARLAPMIEYYRHLTDGQGKPVQFVQNGAEGYAIYNMIAQHVANTIVSVHEIEALFSGDPAYYNWFYDANGVFDISVDKIKRLGALTSTGKNNRVDFEDWVDDMYTVAELEDHKVGSQQYEVIRDLAYQGNLRRVVRNIHGDSALYIFKDEDVDGENIRVITRAKTTEELEQEYASDNVKNEAIVMTTQEFSGYSKNINVADAAVYISPNMYKRLMQSIGEFGPEVEEAFNILTDPNTSIDSFYKMELYSKLLAASLKPLKYMATAQRFENGLGVPYFNKMALFPVFDFIATGDMRKVYERMIKPGDELDMIMFNSAVKAGSKDAKSAYVDGQMSDLDDLTVYTQSFKYIRQQLATDPHTHEEQLAGTQMLKVCMSNLELNGKYGNTEDEKVTGKFIRDNVIEAMNELSNRGVDALRGRFLNADGSFNQEEFSKMLYEELQSRDADDNMLDGVSLTDGKLTVPLASMSNTRWLESILISMINKATVDIYLPGGAFIQRSTFGLDATRQDVISDRMLNNGRKLTLINDDGSMDAIVSINLFSHIIPGYKNKTFAQSRQWLIDNGIIGDSAKANAIGYRIPTQSQASISALRFVDVLPSIMGDTIVLPEEFTKLTGSDFDVDKLYVSRYQYEIYEDSDGTINKQGLLRSVKKARKVEFDEKKSYADNSEDAIKNRLIEMYLKILTDKSRTNELKISIDNDTELVKSLLDIVESNKVVSYPKPFEVYTPQYQEERKAEYTTGKVGIGPMALNNAHHILTQLYNVRFKRDAFTEGLGIVDTNRVYDKDDNRVLSWLSAMINAFVDIAKDPYITRLNINPWTYNMATYMIRVGFGKNTFFMLNQPIIKQMAEAVAKTKGKYGIDQTKTPYELEQEAIEEVLKKYDNSGKIGRTYKFITDKGKPEQRLETYRDFFETDLLQRMITDKDSFDSSEFNENQVRVYYAYKLLSKYAQGLADLVKYSKVDTKKTGKSFFEQMIFREGMRELERSDIFETGDVRRFFENSFIETKTENSVDFGRNLFRGQLFDCNPVVIKSAKTILESIGRSTNASEKLLKTIIGATEAQIKSEFILKMMERDGVTYDDLLRGDQSVAVRLAKLIKDIRTGKYHDLSDVNGNIDNALLNYLLPICDNTGDKNALNFISTNDKFMQSQDANVNDIIYGWEQLLSHPSDEIKKFATDLIYYSFITSGDTPGSNSFFGYVPNSWRISSGYAEAVGNVANSTDFNINRDLIYRNNMMDSDLVPAYDAAERTVVVTDQGDESSDIPFIGINSKHTYPGLGHSVRGIMLGIRDINGQIITRKGEVWPQYIKTKVGKDANNRPMYALYKLAGTVVRKKGKNSDHIPMYVLTSRKGYRNGEYRIVDYRNEGNILENNINEFDMNLFNDVDFCRKVLQKLGESFVSMTVNGNTVTIGNESEEQVSDNPTEFVNHSGEDPDWMKQDYDVRNTHNETLEVLGGVGDAVAESEMSDAIAVAKKGISFEEALSEVTTVFTQEEIAQIKTALNGKPLQVKSVSRQTDPAFFAKEIIKFLEENARKPFTDPTRVNAVEIWTKHDGTPIQDILDACAKYKVAPMVSFSITTLGDTALEKGVLKYTDLIPLIGKLIESGSLDPRTTTVRIDPILVGVTNMDEIRDVVNKCKALGIKKFVTSLVQSYGYTEGRFSKRIPNNRGGWSTEYRYDLVMEEDSEGNVVIKDTNGNLMSGWKSDDRLVIRGINEALSKEGKTYDWDKYYGRRYDGKIEFIPKQQYIGEVGNVLLDIAKDKEIKLETCSFTIKGLKASACLDPMIIERVTGVDVTRPDGTYDRDTSRPECMCYGCHGDMFRFNEKKCFSCCAYCYAAHSGDSAFDYYNEDGTLKDRSLTRVRTANLPTSDQIINIWHGSNENADLSNLVIRPFTTEIYGEQVRVNSVEQAFQLNKLWESFDEMDEDKFNELEQKIMSETNPYEIKRLGRSFKMSPQTRSSWDDMSSDVMYKLIKESFQQNPDALQKLLATGDAVLTHNQEKSKWKTEFPRILMEVREELRETSSQSRQLSLFDNMSQEELNAIEKQKEEHNKKCNR